MALGPGRYDDLCTEVREKAKAAGAILIILEGDRGMGFSVQAKPADLVKLPGVLRHMARAIELDLPSTGLTFDKLPIS